MPQSLRSILGKSGRVRKPTRPAPSQRTSSGSPSPRKGGGPSRKAEEQGTRQGRARDADDGDGPLFEDKLTDLGTARLLAEELTLRDVVQAMRYVRSHMFTPVPPTGLRSTRVAEVLSYRASLPPAVTLAHVHELERMLRDAVSETAADALLAYLRANPATQAVPQGQLASTHTDELVRAGFLTSATQTVPGSTLHVRPEDRTTLTSIHHVSRFASGTVSAVGGSQAIHLAGGGGGAPTLTRPSASSPPASVVGAASSSTASPSSGLPGFRISLPGHGRYLKLAEGAVEWVRETLGKTKWGEAPETWLRERFEGGGLYGTRWKEFWGIEWQWVAGQAVGLGVVEMFETGAVGKGVRALG
ncbi:hypothetical protein HIM_07108 [Hirsutella minnesotensis 3608]|uniref:Serine-threonine protein kinase 19 n=1 Tax=Hirsutella minnesotensis 3608 TaxID=1043627 RepID=A0A0F7ZZ39_9HYPO|nr:hypothetical protein HIM_07108 [Hirsutella minnesotensis 3608]